MLLSLLTEKVYHTMRLPERCEGRFFLQDPETGEELFAITGDGAGWKLSACGNNRVVDDPGETLRSGALLRVRIRDGLQAARLYCEVTDKRYAKYARCPVPDDIEFTVGSDRSCDILCPRQYISARHCVLTCHKRVWHVQDLGSDTGTYVNGIRLDAKTRSLKPGDTVSILNQKFILLPGILALNDQSVDPEACKRILHNMKVPVIAEDDLLARKIPKAFFHRRMRFTSSIVGEDMNIEAPPDAPEQKDKGSALLTYGPTVTAGIGALVASMTNPLAGLGTLAGTILFPQLSRKHNEKLMQEEEEKRQQAYSEYIEKAKKDMEALLAKQEETLRHLSPPPAKELAELLQDDRYMWSRRQEHPDFLTLRMGTGSVPAKANITFPEGADVESNDPMRRRLRELARKPRTLRDVPISLELGRFYNVGIAGPEDARENLALNLILQLAAHVGYDDLKICLLGRLSDRLAPLRWLPHTWDDLEEAHYTARNSEEMEDLIPILDSLLALHRPNTGTLSERIRQELVVLITEDTLANSGLIRRILFDRTYERVHVITLAEHSASLPSHASSLAVGIRAHHGRMKWQEGENAGQLDFIPDGPLQSLALKTILKMANTRLDLRVGAAGMPKVVPFLNMFGVQDAAHLNLLDRWERSDPVRTLRTPLGIGEDGNLCILDLHEKSDGPHGLIAGTTGSGKSELIMSYILSMAVNYSPEEVAFVLIDYKGGGMAQAFEDLPHTAGIITNLDGNEIKRSLMSIESELQRRQRVFSDTERALGCRKLDICAYQRFFREGKVQEPMPHLIIITDEFAELKTQQGEFLAQLIRAARIGRSLGVHLILATQKPGGIVDDQIWSNTNFRICLRVQSPSDSQDVLKCPDAATLTNVGSFYKQVSYGEVMQKAQSAWTGAPYTPESVLRQDCAVEVLAASGSVLRREELTDKASADSGTQVEAVMEYIARIAARENRSVRPLWLPILEKTIPLAALREKYGVSDEPWVLEPVLGEMDDPANQRRMLLRVPVSDGKNAIIYGGIGSGKVMALTTLLEDMLRVHSAEELHVYILDYANDGLHQLRSAPQVGDVLLGDEDEKYARLVRLLKEEIASRKKKLGGAMNSQSISERLQKAGLCNIVVILHGLLAFQQRHDDTLSDFVQMIGEGPRFGVWFIATAESDSGLRIQLQQSFAHRYVLQMNNDDDYYSLLGQTGGFKPAPIRGRGLIQDNGLFEFQTATADEEIVTLCERLDAAWSGPRAEEIRVLPERVEADSLLPLLDPERPLHLPVGLDVQTIRPVFYPFESRAVHLVMGMNWETGSLLEGLLPLAAAAGLRVTALDPEGVTEEIAGVDCVGMDRLETVVSEMYEFCKRIYPHLDDPDAIGERPRRLFVLPSPAQVLGKLSEQAVDWLRRILAKPRPQWNWTFLICGTEDELNTLKYSEEWFKASVSTAEGIILGSASGQMVFQVGGDIQTLYQKITWPMGYTIRRTIPTRVQFVEGRS